MQSGKLPGPKLFQERQIKYFTALIMIMVLGIPFSLYVSASFMLIFTGYINVILFFFIFYKMINSFKRLSKILKIGCIGNGLYSAYAVAAGSFGEGRLSFGDTFDPNDLAFFALGFLPLNLIFITRDNPPWVRLSCFGCFVINILLILKTGSRGGFLAFLLVIVLLLLRAQTIRFSLKACFIGMCIVFLSFHATNIDRYMSIFSIKDDYNVQDETGRLAIWSIGVRAMLGNPITGVGVGCFGEMVGLDRQARRAETLGWQTAHNSAVQIGTETGIIGFALFLLMSFNVFKIFNRVKKNALQKNLTKIGEMGFIGFAGLFVSGMFLSQAYSIYWAFYIVLSAVAHQLLLKEEAPGE